MGRFARDPTMSFSSEGSDCNGPLNTHYMYPITSYWLVFIPLTQVKYMHEESSPDIKRGANFLFIPIGLLVMIIGIGLVAFLVDLMS